MVKIQITAHAFCALIIFFSVLVCNTCTENETCQKRGGVYGCGCLQGQRPNPEIFGKCSHTCAFIHLSKKNFFLIKLSLSVCI